MNNSDSAFVDEAAMRCMVALIGLLQGDENGFLVNSASDVVAKDSYKFAYAMLDEKKRAFHERTEAEKKALNEKQVEQRLREQREEEERKLNGEKPI